MGKSEFYNDFGLFKFSLIAPAINKSHNFRSNNEYFRNISSKVHLFDGKNYRFSISQLKSWYYKYRNRQANK